jgi:5-formyltetrahydrofolate cyclo-ligase
MQNDFSPRSSMPFPDPKREMREALRATRDGLSEDLRERETVACHHALFALPEVQAAKTVLTYMSFGSEIETHTLLDRFLALGKVVVSPRIDDHQRELVLQRVDSAQSMTRGIWGILQPQPESQVFRVNEIDLVLTPGLGFDRHGGRLGYGAGYYDRLLALAPQSVVRVAMAFTCQIVPQVPTAAHDAPIDIIITAGETIRAARQF